MREVKTNRRASFEVFDFDPDVPVDGSKIQSGHLNLNAHLSGLWKSRVSLAEGA